MQGREARGNERSTIKEGDDEKKRRMKEEAYLAGEFDTMLDGRIRLQCLALDFIEEVRATTQKLVMRKLPSLCVS